MNRHTDYKSELAITQELVDQYDSNLQRIISEFRGEVDIKCYEDIVNLKTLKSTKRYASGTVYVNASYTDPGSGGNAYHYSGMVNMPSFSFTPGVIVIDLGFTLFVAAKNKRLNLQDSDDFDGGIESFNGFFKPSNMVGAIQVYRGVSSGKSRAKKYGTSFIATYWAWEE